ncbi:hypothetical protein OMAG_000985, partial [Candidatus Omnitrophus magneticus]
LPFFIKAEYKTGFNLRFFLEDARHKKEEHLSKIRALVIYTEKSAFYLGFIVKERTLFS